ncbi:calcium-binding protein, partial [Arsenophonus nasoniae]|uniref:calcium-binding protein n=1 Tax=Arsenophonus nasoniae TaxID=638 RepID=UPI003879F156
MINRNNLNDFAVIMRRLADIDNHTAQQVIDKHFAQKLQQELSHLPRYASIVNKFSHTMQIVNIIQLISSTQSTIMQLNNANLVDDQRNILEDNLIVAWAASITNFGDQAIQPLLFKAVYRMRGIGSEASTFASRVSAGITLASAGFDLYYAYENFNQLNREQDSAIRQDMIINGTLSLLNAGISVSTALAIFAGSSSAGPIGVAIGTGLMLGGMLYNSYRTVERIKEKVALTTSETLQVGFAAALGLQFQSSVRNKLLKQQTESAIKAYRQQQEKDFFQQLLRPHDFNLSIFITETELVEELPLYYLFDKINNTYLSKHKDSLSKYTFDYLRNNLDIATLSINLWKQQQIDDTIEITSRKFTKEEVEKIIQQYPNRYQVQVAKIKTYIPNSSIASDEILILNREFDNLLKKLINHHRFNNYQFDVDQSKVIYSLPQTQQPVYVYDNLNNYLSKDNLRNYLTGVNFNFANGDDIIVGFASIKNQFICYNGKKIFIGGDKDDFFILLSDKLDKYENKYFHGSQGNDTLYIAQLPYQSSMATDNHQQLTKYSNVVAGTVINLEHGTLRYLNQVYLDDFGDLQSLIKKNYTMGICADLVSIEHAIGAKDVQDLILGNAEDNLLNGNGGKDILYGFSGKDTLVLNNGYANGGEKEDIYIIERYHWQDYQELLPWRNNNYLWNPEDQDWIDLSINSVVLQSGYNFDANIVIDEIEKGSGSVVELQYTLDEIIEVNLVDNDIHIKLLSGKTQLHDQMKESYTNLKLKNVYRNIDDKQLINHEYIIKTVDGFLLSQNLPKVLKKTESIDKIFEIMYFPALDKAKKINSVDPLDINLANNSIMKFGKSYLLPTMIKPMLMTSDTLQTIFHGDKFNNYFTSIKKNSYIYFSHGLDIYLIDNLMTTGNIDDSIIFDFKEIANTYTNEDIFIIILKDHNGYDFNFVNNNLYYQGSVRLPTIKFVNNFGDFYGKIYLLDKNNQYFFISYQDNKYQITPCTTVQIPSEFDDNIFYPKGYSQVIKVNLSAGNDILTDMSETGKIILAGDGNDIITAFSGDNMIVDGNGNDIISTGDGNDIIISTQGNNIIDAGKGNNILAINHGTGDINVLLNEGNNKIFIQGLGGGAVFDYRDNDLVISSRNNNNNNNKITIYDYEKYKN